MAQKLYVIGNGFDLYHSLDTKYESFGCFLQKHHNDIYKLLIATCPLSSSSQWSDFESALGEFEAEEVWDRVRNYMNDYEPERSGEASWEAERIIDDLTSGLRKAFKDFILKVEYPESISDKKLNVDKNAHYLSFNYTDTLEHYYGVDRSDLLNIKNKKNP